MREKHTSFIQGEHFVSCVYQYWGRRGTKTTTKKQKKKQTTTTTKTEDCCCQLILLQGDHSSENVYKTESLSLFFFRKLTDF